MTVSIPITRTISPGTYDVYGKVMRVQTGRGEIISDTVHDVITVYEEAAPPPAPPPPAPPTYSFSIGRITARPERISTGSMVFVDGPVTNRSNVSVPVTVYFRFYEGSALPAHGDFLSKGAGITKTMAPGETFTFSAARIERSDASRFDVACDVTVAGQVIASREDDDVYRKA
ncbi:hypothetical protein ES703_78122 [subsurface metagenome]